MGHYATDDEELTENIEIEERFSTAEIAAKYDIPIYSLLQLCKRS